MVSGVAKMLVACVTLNRMQVCGMWKTRLFCVIFFVVLRYVRE